MKKLLAVLILSFLAIAVSAQEVRKPIAHLPFQHRHSVQLDAGGAGLYYSVNYEGVFANGGLFKGTIRAGGALYPPSTGIIGIWLPITVNGLVTLGAHHIELGAGVIPTRDNFRPWPEYAAPRTAWSMFTTGRLGYRYQKPDGHLILKATFTPIMEMPNLLVRGTNNGLFSGFALYPLGALTVGYAF